MARPDRRRTIVAVVLATAVSLAMAGVASVALLRSGDGAVARDDPVRVVPALALPSPRTDGEMSLEEAILRRGSVREFETEPLTLGQLGQLLWAAQGQREQGRTAPSAGGLYPLEVYVAHEGGIYHYRPDGHEVAAVSNTDIRDDLAAAALDQRAFHTAPAVIAIAGVEERSAVKYGGRAEQYVLIEVGHAAQNVLLQAAVLGIGAVPTGAFEDPVVAELFGMPDGTEPLYLIPVGRPA